MQSIPPELNFLNEGSTSPFARLCIEATFYWRGSMYVQGAELASAYAKALDVVKPGILWFESGSMSGAKRLKPDTLGMVPHWLAQSKRREDIHIMELKGGASSLEVSDVGLKFFADEEEDPAMGALSVTLPVSAVDEPERIVRLVEEVAACADFESGHCGYSLNWDPRGDTAPDAQASMMQIAGRFRGVDLPKLNASVSSLRRSAKPALKSVQWLTYMGDSLLSRLGNPTEVATLLKSAGTVRSLPRGILVQAGSVPMLGDVNRREDLTALQRVGRIVSGLRVANHAPIFGTRDQTNEWLARFD